MCDQGSAGNAADMRADADEDAAAAAAPAAVAHDGDAPGGPVAAAAAAAAPPARRAREDGAAMASPPPKKQRAIVAAGKKAAQSHKGSPDPLVAVLKDAIVGFTAAVTPKAAVAHVTDVLRKVRALRRAEWPSPERVKRPSASSSLSRAVKHSLLMRKSRRNVNSLSLSYKFSSNPSYASSRPRRRARLASRSRTRAFPRMSSMMRIVVTARTSVIITRWSLSIAATAAGATACATEIRCVSFDPNLTQFRSRPVVK